MIKRFTAFRRNLAQRGTHNPDQMNAEDEPQFEGVIFSDGTVAIRWLTACKSTSVWASLDDMLRIHGHPEYGTDFVWSDDAPPQEWFDQIQRAKDAGLME